MGRSHSDRGLLLRGLEDIFSFIKIKKGEAFPEEFGVTISACLLHSKQVIDIISLPQSSCEKLKTIKCIKDLATIKLQDVVDLKKIIKQLYKQLKSLGSEWGETDIERKSHVIFSITINKRQGLEIEEILDEQDTLRQWARIDIIKLCGSELAKPNSGFFSILQNHTEFATSSFNSLSNQLLQAALNSKGKNRAKGKNIVGNEILSTILKRAITANNKIAFITCVSLNQTQVSISIPALKFASRIRKCICTEMSKRQKKENISDCENLKVDIEQMCEKGKLKGVEMTDWIEKKEAEVMKWIGIMEEKMNDKSSKDHSILCEQYEELLLLKDKIGLIKKEQMPSSQGFKMQSGAKNEYSPIRSVRTTPLNDIGNLKENYSGRDFYATTRIAGTEKTVSVLLKNNGINEKRIAELENQVELLQSSSQNSKADIPIMKYFYINVN